MRPTRNTWKKTFIAEPGDTYMLKKKNNKMFTKLCLSNINEKNEEKKKHDLIPTTTREMIIKYRLPNAIKLRVTRMKKSYGKINQSHFNLIQTNAINFRPSSNHSDANQGSEYKSFFHQIRNTVSYTHLTLPTILRV